jgi:predicted GIY-YIG superfamily endonuclease
MERTYVYWIHVPTHVDPYSQGYVGVSKHPMKRFVDHAYTKNPYLKRALKRHANIQLSILHECASREEALNYERDYRPTERVGWNIIIGGLSPRYGTRRSDETRRKISASHKKRGTNPYSSKTHSPQAIAKSKTQKAGRKWYYNPQTQQTRQCRIAPEGWLLGRFPADKITNHEYRIKLGLDNRKIRGNDYTCHVKAWRIVTLDGNIVETTNLKDWCNANGHGYHTVYGSAKGWKCEKINK